MRLNVDTLGTFYEMARQGAGLAADRLTQMSGVENRVIGTRIEFSSPERVAAELASSDGYAGTVVDLSGGLDGQTVVLFDNDDARAVAETLVGDLPAETAYSASSLVRSAVPELCAIMNNGFVDGWANVLDREIQVSTPRFVSGNSAARSVDTAAGDVALLFRSRIGARGSETDFRHYFLPAAETTRELFLTDRGIHYRNLVGFDTVAQRGTDRVTADLSKLTGIETTIDVRRVSFLALDAIPEAVPNERLASVAFSFDGTPSGYLLFLYDKYSAGKLAETMVGTSPATGLGEMGRDAIKEASNIMASGLLDGWANALETTIRHTTPAFTWEMGPAAVDPLIVGLSESQEFAFVFDTRVEAADESFDISIYVIPDEADFERAVDAVDPEQAASVSPAADVDMSELDTGDLADVQGVE